MEALLALCDFETTGLEPERDEPIEVGILFVDCELRVVHSFESLIRYTKPLDERSWPAFAIHRIGMPMLAHAPEKEDVARRLVASVKMAKALVRARRCVLCSDNAQFEHRFMLNLLGNQEWPFHYCTWDTSLFLEMVGVGDPDPVHRAMADVGRLHSALIEARNLVAGKR